MKTRVALAVILCVIIVLIGIVTLIFSSVFLSIVFGLVPFPNVPAGAGPGFCWYWCGGVGG